MQFWKLNFGNVTKGTDTLLIHACPSQVLNLPFENTLLFLVEAQQNIAKKKEKRGAAANRGLSTMHLGDR